MILHQGRSIYRVHVGGINYSTTVAMLRNAFEKFGTVLDGTEIIYDKEGRSKGFGFVNFAEESAFKKAIEQMNGRELDGRTISVTSAQPERKHNETVHKRRNGATSNGLRPSSVGPFPFRGYRVTIHNLPPTVTWPDLKDFLRKAGEVQFADVVGPGLGIGEFATPHERANVIRQLNGKDLKGNRVSIRNLNEADPRFQASRQNTVIVGAGNTNNNQFSANYFPEHFDYGPNPHPSYDIPFNPRFEPYSFSNGATGPNGAPLTGAAGGPIDFSPAVGFGPPHSRIPPWLQAPGRGTGRGYPQFVAPYPPPPGSFPRAQVRPAANGWMFPSAPARPCPPGRGFERPPPPPVVYSQPSIHHRKIEYDHQAEMAYRRSPSNGAVVDMSSVEHVVYQKRPASIDRDYSSYPAGAGGGGRYNHPMADSPPPPTAAAVAAAAASANPREKPTPDYNRSKDEWSAYFRCFPDSHTDGNNAPYMKYDRQGSGGRPVEKIDSGGGRPYGRYPVHNEDPRVEYPDYTQSGSLIEDRRKDYSRSGGYTGYLNSSYSRSTAADQLTNGYDYDDYGHGGSGGANGNGGDGYPASELYSKDRADYEYPRGDARSYASDYETREGGGQYYEHRPNDYQDRSYRDEDPRGAGGADRRRPAGHRTGPYDH